ncbi:MarR family winged helix-turn-helix transcriptional regulator [Mangrovicoccus ximenensis]|uniref:MarR family winged helix-turn-helix transcriptional regulator n=1 Tax=Mangrovicoccus ximenensis TaxID=1911570 RepID=UPI00191C3BD0|nr:MarR family winged helix-turn-helix transcriptional regulator [Mangrovicoccus ximenensis]
MTEDMQGLPEAPDEGGETPALLRAACDNDWAETGLRDRPGFLIRRLHQIHTALFMQECASEGLTPVQYSVLTALGQMGPSEQIAISRAVGLDRTSTADVMQRLEKRKMIRRRTSPKDRRSKIATLTEVGESLLQRIDAAASAAHTRTLEPLGPDERRELMQAMRKIVDAFPDLERKAF